MDTVTVERVDANYSVNRSGKTHVAGRRCEFCRKPIETNHRFEARTLRGVHEIAHHVCAVRFGWASCEACVNGTRHSR